MRVNAPDSYVGVSSTCTVPWGVEVNQSGGVGESSDAPWLEGVITLECYVKRGPDCRRGVGSGSYYGAFDPSVQMDGVCLTTWSTVSRVFFIVLVLPYPLHYKNFFRKLLLRRKMFRSKISCTGKKKLIITIIIYLT